jgi:hypothetical protein
MAEVLGQVNFQKGKLISYTPHSRVPWSIRPRPMCPRTSFWMMLPLDERYVTWILHPSIIVLSQTLLFTYENNITLHLSRREKTTEKVRREGSARGRAYILREAQRSPCPAVHKGRRDLKVHKREKFFGSNFELFTIL